MEARSAARDLLKTLLLAAICLGVVFILYAAVDRSLDLSVESRAAISCSLFAIAVGWVLLDSRRKAKRRGPLKTAVQIERVVGLFNNQLVLVVEQQIAGLKLPHYLAERIHDDLNRKLSTIKGRDVVRLLPGRPVTLAMAVVVAGYAALFFFSPNVLRDLMNRLVFLDSSMQTLAASFDAPASSNNADAVNAGAIEEIRVILSPPAYTQQNQVTQTDEGNITALAGTRVDVFLKHHSSDCLAFLSVGGEAGAQMKKIDDSLYQGQFIIREDSNYKVSLVDQTEQKAKWEGIYGVKVITDNPPEIHFTRPTGDLLFKAAERPASIDIEVASKDDYGLAVMRLKYIKSTGEGDASRFQSGEVAIPTQVSSNSGIARGAARLSLDALGVEPGSSIVFHAEARDRNNVTGPGIGFSETLVVQIAEPEKVRISLDNLLPQEGLKHLTSQRMILIKTERLHRQRGSITPPSFLSSAKDIGLEQRRFRQSFNEFSEIEAAIEHDLNATEANESETGEHEQLRDGSVPEISAGASETVQKMILALRAMWRAETALAAGDTAAAIVSEKEALAHLKAAQKASRYFSRSTASLPAIDLKRRYMGELAAIKSRLERLPKRKDGPVETQLRAGLSIVYDAARRLSRQDGPGANAAAQASTARDLDRAAEDLLSIKGDKASAFVDAASKLKLVSRMLAEHTSTPQVAPEARATQRANMIGLIAQVASELFAHLGGANRSAVILPSPRLDPGNKARAAEYFKLLANP